MDSSQSNFNFKLMSFFFKLRDFFFPRKNILKEVEIKPGFHILDYGCGPGSYITAASEPAGKSGTVYALDINPLAIQKVERIIFKKQLTNIKTITSDRKTGLPDNSINVVLLYDTLHELNAPDGVLEELYRVLKPKGILSLSDHHLKENEIMAKVTRRGLFKLLKKGEKTYSFLKEK